MGQYYRPVLIDMITLDYKVLNRTVDGQYTMAKLTEHSWFGNPLCDTIGKMLSEQKIYVAWVGDYTENEEIIYKLNKKIKRHECCLNLDYDKIWEVDGVAIKSFNFDWQNKIILNHTKECYIDVNKYWNASKIDIKTEEGMEAWVINPIPILTSIGNGRGGGDYRGLCMEDVGSWAGDLLSIVDREDFIVPYKEFNVAFKEECYCE